MGGAKWVLGGLLVCHMGKEELVEIKDWTGKGTEVDEEERVKKKRKEEKRDMILSKVINLTKQKLYGVDPCHAKSTHLVTSLYFSIEFLIDN